MYTEIYYLSTGMANKTIYVSDEDVSLFDRAKEIAGEALSSVIARALREFVARNEAKANGIIEISVTVGPHNGEREQRFLGTFVSEWKGFSDDHEWWMSASIYYTQKGNIAVHLTTVSHGSLLTNKKKWKESGAYLVNPKTSVLLVAKQVQELKGKVPEELYKRIESMVEKEEKPVEYLDI